jgi:replicative DNA helicase
MGLPELDRVITGGAKPGDTVMIGARPGSGKSFLAHHILSFNARKGKRGLFVSVEMTAVQIGARGFSYSTKIDSAKILGGKLKDSDWTPITKAAGERERLPLYLVAHKGIADKKMVIRPPITINLIDAVLSSLASEGIFFDLCAIDYAQRIRSDFGYTTRKDIVDEVSSGSKDLALKWSMPVFLTSQLGRQVDARTPPIPQESDFKESGNLEEDGDIILTLFNPLKYYDVGTTIPCTNPPRLVQENQLCIQLHKQRGGPSNRSLWFYFDPRFALFAGLERELADDY